MKLNHSERLSEKDTACQLFLSVFSVLELGGGVCVSSGRPDWPSQPGPSVTRSGEVEKLHGAEMHVNKVHKLFPETQNPEFPKMISKYFTWPSGL